VQQKNSKKIFQVRKPGVPKKTPKSCRDLLLEKCARIKEVIIQDTTCHICQETFALPALRDIHRGGKLIFCVTNFQSFGPKNISGSFLATFLLVPIKTSRFKISLFD